MGSILLGALIVVVFATAIGTWFLITDIVGFYFGEIAEALFFFSPGIVLICWFLGEALASGSVGAAQ